MAAVLIPIDYLDETDIRQMPAGFE